MEPGTPIEVYHSVRTSTKLNKKKKYALFSFRNDCFLKSCGGHHQGPPSCQASTHLTKVVFVTAQSRDNIPFCSLCCSSIICHRCQLPPPHLVTLDCLLSQHIVSFSFSFFFSFTSSPFSFTFSFDSSSFYFCFSHWPMAVSRCMVECLLFYAFFFILYSQGSIAWSLKNTW